MNYPSGKKATVLFFFLIGALLVVSVTIYQPSVHYFFDAVGMRDGNLFLSTLSFTFEDIRKFIRAAVYHVHGPLAYIISNIYYLLVGEYFGLGPKVVHFPNAVIVFFTALYCYLLGKRVYSSKFGYVFALLYVLSPWVIQTVRQPYPAFILSPLLQIMAVYYFTLFIQNSNDLKNRILGPVVLSLYLMIALDWPPFLIFLFAYLYFNNRFGDFAGNRFVLLPAVVFLVWILWFLRLVIAGTPMIITPFNHVFRTTWKVINFDLSTYAFFFADSLGIVGILAFAGFISVLIKKWNIVGKLFLSPKWLFTEYPRQGAKVGDHSHLRETLVLCFSGWFFMAIVPLIATSLRSFTAFVVGIPLAFVATLAVERFKAKAIFFLAVIMLPWIAWSVILAGPVVGFKSDQQYQYAGPIQNRYDDVRVLAMAAYLIEYRQDLLAENKTSFVPRNVPANALQYARGKNRRIITKSNLERYFPESKIKINPNETKNLEFINAYRDRGEFNADWLMLIPRLLELPYSKPSRDFYIRLKNDPRIYWSVILRDRYGREVWLGEVRDKGQAIEKAKVMDVEPLAKFYQEKYNRLSSLKRNPDFLNKY